MPPDRRVALLRGINVGRAKRVAMADLRKLVEGLGYQDVRTLLNSGNVVFTVPASNRREPGPAIEAALSQRTGITARVTVLTAAEVRKALQDNPLLKVATDPSRLMVSVPATAADRSKLAPLSKQDWAPEALALGPRVVYQWCPKGILDSAVATAVAKALGDAVTARNWATFTKLGALLTAD